MVMKSRTLSIFITPAILLSQAMGDGSNVLDFMTITDAQFLVLGSIADTGKA